MKEISKKYFHYEEKNHLDYYNFYNKKSLFKYITEIWTNLL